MRDLTSPSDDGPFEPWGSTTIGQYDMSSTQQIQYPRHDFKVSDNKQQQLERQQKTQTAAEGGHKRSKAKQEKPVLKKMD